MRIVDALFGCWHKQISFPQTSKPGQRRCEAAKETGTYVVCLDCGTEFAYDWKKMRVLSPIESLPLPTHVWKLKPAEKSGRGSRAMKKQWWFRAIESTGLVFGYLWYGTNVPSMVARVLS